MSAAAQAPREFFSNSADYLIAPGARLVDLAADIVCLLEGAEGVVTQVAVGGSEEGRAIWAAVYTVRQALGIARAVSRAIEGKLPGEES